MWSRLALASSEPVALGPTLLCGQAFRWRAIAEQQHVIYRGVLGRCVVDLGIEPGSAGTALRFRCVAASSSTSPIEPLELESQLQRYFRLDDVRWDDMVASWTTSASTYASTKDPLTQLAQEQCARFRGLRILRQDPHETLFSFICSQNNNVKRIQGLVESLCKVAGTYIGSVDGLKFHAFPTLEQLQSLTEEQLRQLGFGYRAKYIVATAAQLKDRNSEADTSLRGRFLQDMHLRPYEEAVEELQKFTGVGRKVADCVLLFGCGFDTAVPVDTHVWQITQDHVPALKGKSLTPARYKTAVEFWQGRFGIKSGWAQQILFAQAINAPTSATDGASSALSSSASSALPSSPAPAKSVQASKKKATLTASKASTTTEGTDSSSTAARSSTKFGKEKVTVTKIAPEKNSTKRKADASSVDDDQAPGQVPFKKSRSRR